MTGPAAEGCVDLRSGASEFRGRSRVGRPRWRIVLALVGLCAVSSLLTSCSPTPELGFRLAPDGRRVEVLVNPCKDLRMHRITVSKSLAAEPLWRTVWELSSPNGSQLSRVTIGEAPPGFETKTALRGRLEPDATYNVGIGEGYNSVGYFKPRQLRRSAVLYHGSYVTERQYRERAPDACPASLDWTPAYVLVGTFVLIAGITVIFGGLLVRRGLRNRSRGSIPPSHPDKTHLPPPPPPPSPQSSSP